MAKQNNNYKQLIEKINYILHPKKGIFVDIAKINQKATRAHERLDRIDQRKDRLIKILIAIISPIIVFLIINFLKG